KNRRASELPPLVLGEWAALRVQRIVPRSGGLRSQHLPHLLRRRRHVDVIDAERRQRIEERIDLAGNSSPHAGASNESAPLHYACGRRGGDFAARGASPAIGQGLADRVYRTQTRKFL